jgi:hypothetical protein
VARYGRSVVMMTKRCKLNGTFDVPCSTRNVPCSLGEFFSSNNGWSVEEETIIFRGKNQ